MTEGGLSSFVGTVAHTKATTVAAALAPLTPPALAAFTAALAVLAAATLIAPTLAAVTLIAPTRAPFTPALRPGALAVDAAIVAPVAAVAIRVTVLLGCTCRRTCVCR
jgi:hypothetical protein